MPEQDKFLVDPFAFLADAFQRPPLFGEYTVDRLWQDEHISQRMLELHLDKDAELASRPHAFVERSAEWIKSRFQIGADTVDYFGFLATFKYDSEQVSLDKYTIVERGGVRRFYNWLQHYLFGKKAIAAVPISGGWREYGLQPTASRIASCPCLPV